MHGEPVERVLFDVLQAPSLRILHDMSKTGWLREELVSAWPYPAVSGFLGRSQCHLTTLVVGANYFTDEVVTLLADQAALTSLELMTSDKKYAHRYEEPLIPDRVVDFLAGLLDGEPVQVLPALEHLVLRLHTQQMRRATGILQYFASRVTADGSRQMKSFMFHVPTSRMVAASTQHLEEGEIILEPYLDMPGLKARMYHYLPFPVPEDD